MTTKTNLLSTIVKPVGQFRKNEICNQNADKIADMYEKSGFGTASKLAKVAKLDYKYFTPDMMNGFLNRLSIYKDYGQWDFENREIKYDTKNEFTGYKRKNDFDKNIEELENRLVKSEMGRKQWGNFNYESSGPLEDELSIYKEAQKKENLLMYKAVHTGENKVVDVIITEDKIEDFHEVPPLGVLNAVVEAQEQNVFDEITVIDVEKSEPRNYKSDEELLRDPIVCGKIKGKPDMYFVIAYWDENVEVDNILNQHPKAELHD